MRKEKSTSVRRRSRRRQKRKHKQRHDVVLHLIYLDAECHTSCTINPFAGPYLCSPKHPAKHGCIPRSDYNSSDAVQYFTDNPNSQQNGLLRIVSARDFSVRFYLSSMSGLLRSPDADPIVPKVHHTRQSKAAAVEHRNGQCAQNPRIYKTGM